MSAKDEAAGDKAVEVADDSAVADDVAIDAMYVALDVSMSIRGGPECMYPAWVTEDIKKLSLPAPPTRWILWGSDAEPRETRDEVVEYLADDDKTLGGTDPFCFVKRLPAAGVIDLHVYTDGEIGEYSVTEARKELAEHHADLKVRRVVISYVNKNLDQMNVGLSAIFDGHVLQMHRTRVADGTKLLEFDAAPISSSVTFVDILDQYFVLGKTEQEMTKGVHYLGQRYYNADPAQRSEIRRAIKERMDAVNEEHRTRRLTGEEEQALCEALDRGDWMAVRKPFVGHAVSDEVKLMQGYCQRFLNESKDGALIRISAYAPLVLEGSKGSGGQFDELEEVLLDHIMFLGMAKESVIVMPVKMAMPEQPRPPAVRGKSRAARIERLAVRARLLNTPVKCALAVDVKANFDNTFGLDTLFALREQQKAAGAAPWHEPAEGDFHVDDFVQDLQAGAHLRSAGDAAAHDAAHDVLSSGAHTFGVNPFTRQPMDCVLLVPASPEALSADRLAQVDAWNTHMLSRFVRGGRSMPSEALVLALVLEKAFANWRAGEMTRPEDRAEAERLRDVWRRYIGRLSTPLTFTVGLPVVIRGTFATAARIACAVLRAALDPSLPLDVLAQFWRALSEEDAAKVWAALVPHAGLADEPFPAAHHRTLCALMAGLQYSKSGRDARLRAKKGRSYSVRMYTKRLDQLVTAGCHPQRLAVEEKAVRKDLTGVAESEPLLCAHGVEPDQCRSLDGQQPDTLCLETCRPTLLNRTTMDMWYVGQPEDSDTRALESFHKAMWQLVRKRTKGKRPRFDKLPPPEATFEAYVNHRVRAARLEKGDAAAVLPTLPCARLAQDIALTYQSYVELLRAKPSITRQRFMKALRAPREVCEFNDCCQYIREAVTEEQRAWIDAHATHDKVAGDKDVLSGKVSYRSL